MTREHLEERKPRTSTCVSWVMVMETLNRTWKRKRKRPLPPPRTRRPGRGAHLWSAKDSSFSALSVPAEANMMVVSRSAMIPDTALAAVMQAWVPLLPACRAESTKDT